jgi:hypothetical protein
MTPQELKVAAAAVQRSNDAARGAALAWRARHGVTASAHGDFGAVFRGDFGAIFGADVVPGEGVWVKIKRFFGFIPPGADVAAALAQLPAAEIVMQAPEVVASGAQPVGYIPDLATLPKEYGGAGAQPEHTMALEGTDALVNAVNAHAAALPQKIAELQANPTPAKLADTKATALRLQGQQMLMIVPSLPVSQQGAMRAQAQALLNQASGIEAQARGAT